VSSLWALPCSWIWGPRWDPDSHAFHAIPIENPESVLPGEPWSGLQIRFRWGLKGTRSSYRSGWHVVVSSFHPLLQLWLCLRAMPGEIFLLCVLEDFVFSQSHFGSPPSQHPLLECHRFIRKTHCLITSKGSGRFNANDPNFNSFLKSFLCNCETRECIKPR
jgi:hypothetical protein